MCFGLLDEQNKRLKDTVLNWELVITHISHILTFLLSCVFCAFLSGDWALVVWDKTWAPFCGLTDTRIHFFLPCSDTHCYTSFLFPSMASCPVTTKERSCRLRQLFVFVPFCPIFLKFCWSAHGVSTCTDQGFIVAGSIWCFINE